MPEEDTLQPIRPGSDGSDGTDNDANDNNTAWSTSFARGTWQPKACISRGIPEIIGRAAVHRTIQAFPVTLCNVSALPPALISRVTIAARP